MANSVFVKIFLDYHSSVGRLCALAVLGLSGVICPGVAAQALDSRPVARLVSAGPVYPAPRRIETSAHYAKSTVASPSFEDATAIERRAFEETNRVRIQNGYAPLRWDAELCRVARSHSENMARQGFFSHVAPDGRRLRDRAKAVGIEHFSVLGENIAYNLGYQDPGGFAVERWMASADHRANILSSEFHDMAIGTFVGSDGSVYLTQIFITR